MITNIGTRKTVLATILILQCCCASAQKTELYLGLHAGMFRYSGATAVNSSFIVHSGSMFDEGYTNDQFGKKAKPGPGLSVSLQRIGKSNFIYGITGGVETLKNKVLIMAIATPTSYLNATGSVVFTSTFCNLQPFAGYRFKTGKYEFIDLFAGADFAIGLGERHEKGSAQQANTTNTYETDRDRGKTGFDPRLGVGARIAYKKFSLNAGYWFGLKDAYVKTLGAEREAYSRLLRAGLAYRIL